MDKREELVELSGQIINGIISCDKSFVFDKVLNDCAAKASVALAYKIQQEIDKKNGTYHQMEK